MRKLAYLLTVLLYYCPIYRGSSTVQWRAVLSTVPVQYQYTSTVKTKNQMNPIKIPQVGLRVPQPSCFGRIKRRAFLGPSERVKNEGAGPNRTYV